MTKYHCALRLHGHLMNNDAETVINLLRTQNPYIMVGPWTIEKGMKALQDPEHWWEFENKADPDLWPDMAALFKKLGLSWVWSFSDNEDNVAHLTFSNAQTGTTHTFGQHNERPVLNADNISHANMAQLKFWDHFLRNMSVIIHNSAHSFLGQTQNATWLPPGTLMVGGHLTGPLDDFLEDVNLVFHTSFTPKDIVIETGKPLCLPLGKSAGDIFSSDLETLSKKWGCGFVHAWPPEQETSLGCDVIWADKNIDNRYFVETPSYRTKPDIRDYNAVMRESFRLSSSHATLEHLATG